MIFLSRFPLVEKASILQPTPVVRLLPKSTNSPPLNRTGNVSDGLSAIIVSYAEAKRLIAAFGGMSSCFSALDKSLNYK